MRAFAVLLVLLALGVGGWYYSGPRVQTMTFVVDPPALDAPGTIVISWTAPAGARVEATPRRVCAHRGTHMVCTLEETTVFTLTVWKDTKRIGQRIIEVPVGPPR